MIKFKNGEFLEASNQIEKITFEKINICRFAPDEEYNKYIYVTYHPTSVAPVIVRRYQIIIEGESCHIDRIKDNLMQFMKELYDAKSLGYINYKGTVVIGIPWILIYCYKFFCTGEYWNEESLEAMDTIHDLVLLCNDEAYEKYKQKLLDDFKDTFANFKPKVYTDKDWLDAYKYETIRHFENGIGIIELKENEKMPPKDFERIEGISIVGTHDGFIELDDFIKERNKMKIDKVIFNNPATIVFWKDGTKTIVKADDEEFDKEKGLAMAIAKKALGNKGNYYEEFKKHIGEQE